MLHNEVFYQDDMKNKKITSSNNKHGSWEKESELDHQDLGEKSEGGPGNLGPSWRELTPLRRAAPYSQQFPSW